MMLSAYISMSYYEFVMIMKIIYVVNNITDYFFNHYLITCFKDFQIAKIEIKTIIPPHNQ